MANYSIFTSRSRSTHRDANRRQSGGSCKRPILSLFLHCKSDKFQIPSYMICEDPNCNGHTTQSLRDVEDVILFRYYQRGLMGELSDGDHYLDDSLELSEYGLEICPFSIIQALKVYACAVAEHEKDLTRYGVEPNPGPKGSKHPVTAHKKAAPHPKSQVLAIGNDKGFTPMKGRGDYTAEGIGSALGNWLGGMAGRLFKKVTGIGAYTVQDSTSRSPPIFGKGAPIIEHREYITDIYSSVGFNINSFSINPGLHSTFPWLSSLASNFEEYQVIGMIFEFVFTSAVALNSTNTVLGTVILVTEYDVEDASFSSKLQMENHMFAVSAPPSQHQLSAVECNPRLTPVTNLFTRTGDVPTGADARLYDHGIFSIATVGMQAASVNIGELWVTYKIKLLKPALSLSTTFTPWAHYYSNNPGAIIASNRFQSMVDNSVGSTIALTFDSASKLLFPPSLNNGTYLLFLGAYGTGASLILNVPVQTNCSLVQIWGKPSSSLNSLTIPSSGTTSGRFAQIMILDITGKNATLGFSAADVLPTAITSFDVFLVAVPYNIARGRKGVSKGLQSIIDRLAALEERSLGERKESESYDDLSYDSPTLSQSTLDLAAQIKSLTGMVTPGFNKSPLKPT